MKHKHQDFSLKIKSADDTGQFEGVAAAYNNVDFGGDQILPGAFARTLQSTKQFPLLWQHRSDEPIGTVSVADSPQGLQVKGQLLMDLDQAKRAYQLIKAKVIKGLSIGFETIQESYSDGVRQLKEIKLWEVSIVTFPMNELATIGSVKSLSPDELKRHLKGIVECQKGIKMHSEKMAFHLKSILDPEDEGGDYDSAIADNPSLLEGSAEDDDPDEYEDMSKGLSEELQKLVLEVQELNSR